MKRIALRWLGALLLSITLAAPALAAGKHLINGIDANYPPFAYVDETGKPAGFDVDSMNWIAKKMGFTVEHKPMDWDGIIPALLAKKIDMVCSGMSISPERKAQANFSDPYWTIRKIFITKKGSKVTEDQIYNGKIKLGVQRGTNEHEMLQKAQAEKKYNYQLRFYDSGPMAIEDLLNGRAGSGRVRFRRVRRGHPQGRRRNHEARQRRLQAPQGRSLLEGTPGQVPRQQVMTLTPGAARPPAFSTRLRKTGDAASLRRRRLVVRASLFGKTGVC